jgi:hypothetical protein
VTRPAAGQIGVEERSYGARKGAAAFRDREAIIGGAHQPVSVRMHQQRGIRHHRLRQRPEAPRDNAALSVCIRCEPQALSDFSWRKCSRGGGRHELTSLVPGPREQFVDLLHRMVRQAGKDVGEPGLRIDVI